MCYNISQTFTCHKKEPLWKIPLMMIKSVSDNIVEKNVFVPKIELLELI